MSGYKPYVRSQCDFCCISHVNQWLQTLCSFPIRFMQYSACKAVVTNPMSVPNAIFAVFRDNSVVTNPMFVPNAISVVFRMWSSCYKPYFRSSCDFCNISNVNQWLQTQCSFSMRFLSISHINQWLQTLCSFPMRFLPYFTCKSVVTNPMFVPNTISALFRM